METNSEDLLSEALATLKEYTPAAVAIALPEYGLSAAAQADVILSWDETFATDVFKHWKPPQIVWDHVAMKVSDDRRVVTLMSLAVGLKNATMVISGTATCCGPARLVRLMKALRAVMQELSSPTIHRVPNPTRSTAHLVCSTDTPTVPAPPQKPSSFSHSPNSPIISSSTNLSPAAPQSRQSSSTPLDPSQAQVGQRTAEVSSSPHELTTPIDQSQVLPTPGARVIPPPRPKHVRSAASVAPAYVRSLFAADDGQASSSDPSPRDPPTQQRHLPEAADYSPNHPPVPIGHQANLSDIQGSPNPSSHNPADDPIPVLIPRLPAQFPNPDDVEGDDGHSESGMSNGGANDDECLDDQLAMDGGQVTGNENTAGLENNAGSSAPDENEAPDESYPDGYVDPTTPDLWAWSEDKNNEKVEDWEAEIMIQEDPTSTAPVRAYWMYAARKGDLSDEEYAEIVKAEHKAFLKIPVVCRAAVGQMYYKDSKLDWEIRQFWAPDMYEYVQCKHKSEEAGQVGDTAEESRLETERKDLVQEAMRRLFERFPDCRPSHPLRKIEEKGNKVLGRYYAKFRDKFTSDAGRMKRLYQKSLGKADMLAAKHSTMTLLEVLGRKRVHLAHQLWGGSTAGGVKECDVEIAKELDDWRRKNPTMTNQDASRQRIKIVQSVRHRLFTGLSTPVKQVWKKRAKAIHIPTTPEEEQCLADAALSYLDELLELLAKRANIHFFLLAAARGSCNIPVIIREFTKNPVEDELFYKPSEGFGTRIRTDYLAYSLKRFGAGIEEVVFGLPEVVDDQNEDEDSVNDNDNETSNKTQKGKAKKPDPPRKTYIPPFQPDPSKTQSVAAKRKAISEFILTAIEKLHSSRVSWDKVTKDASIYIDPQRMPMDPDVQGQRLQLQKPAAMTDTRVKALFDFLVSSYNGTLPEEQAFRFKHEARHLNLPAPVPPSDPTIHHAAVAAAKTAIPKRKKDDSQAAKDVNRPKKVRKPEEDADDGYHDIEGLMLELEESYTDDAQELTSGAKTQRKEPKKGRSTRFLSPSPPPEEPNAPSPSRQDASLPMAASSSEAEPLIRPRTLSSQSNVTPTNHAVELSHAQFRPGHAISGEWASTKAFLERWGENITFSDHEARTMPFSGLPGNHKPDVQPPNGLHSVLCILQLWIAYQGEPSEEGVSCVSLSPRLGLPTLHPTHRVSVNISLLLDTDGPLPSAKYVYNQAHFSVEEADALFTQIEGSVSQFIDAMAASEEVVFNSNLGLLQAMRVAVFLKPSGFIRDGNKAGPNDKRTTAIVDRFVTVAGAIALVRYFKVVLGRVAELYAQGSRGTRTGAMWKLFASFWSSACRTLARAVVASRSDLFSLGNIRQNMPREFNTPIELAFAAQAWWTPGGSGTPGPVIIPTGQVFETEQLFNYVKKLDWSKYSLVERSQVMLILFTGAVQTESGCVAEPQVPKSAQSTTELMSEALKHLNMSIERSTEAGARESPINIPTDDLNRAINRWEEESKLESHAFNESPQPENEDTNLQSGGGEEAFQSASSANDLHQSPAPHPNPPSLESRSGTPSQETADSRVQPEEEDQIFSNLAPNPVSTSAEPSDQTTLTVVNDEGSTKKVIPAIRPLEDASDPRPKKRRGREVDPRPLVDGEVRRLRSSKDTQAPETPNTPKAPTTRTKRSMNTASKPVNRGGKTAPTKSAPAKSSEDNRGEDGAEAEGEAEAEAEAEAEIEAEADNEDVRELEIFYTNGDSAFSLDLG
ncbi:hypothetical protein FRC01_013099 [Tulasnella sp. 417]|nr:hypothetical protein FRC01_013099 [Tulasnella sp. 417]